MAEERGAEPGAVQQGPWHHLVDRIQAQYNQFRASQLYGQVLLSLGLVAITGLVATLPGGPMMQAREGLTRVVMQDYDFAGRARDASQWAKERGGWSKALTGLWQSASGRLQTWAGPLLPRETGGQAPPTETAVPEPEPPVAQAQRPKWSDTVMPVTGNVMYGFGWLPKGRQVHEGLDLAAAEGAPVAAIADGTVLRVETDPVLGALLEVDHGFAVALYAQVKNAKVKPGDVVTRGQTLALIAKPTGKEGDAGAHLHFEIRPTREGKAVDPTPYLPVGRSQQGGSGI